MHIHYLQHVPFENAANITVWARNRGHAVTRTRLCDGEDLPSLDSFDWLVIMGGLMNIYEEEAYPWLVTEKKFIEEAVADGKFVLGICLGAQLIADVLGGAVTRHRHKEIGWFPVSLTEQGTLSPVFEGFPRHFDVFQWHGDTFSIPPGADKLAESPGCSNQAFQYAGHVVGLQFHLEYSIRSIDKMLRYCADEMVGGPGIQSAESIRGSYRNVPGTSRLLHRLLDNLHAQWQTAGESRCFRSPCAR